MRALFFFFGILSLLSGCGSRWAIEDWDGDGWTIAAGDCIEYSPEDTGIVGNFLEEAYGVLPEEVNPGAKETWYDGIDQDCDGKDDYDQDGDGYVPDCYVGFTTFPWADSTGNLTGGDCNDKYDLAYPGAAELDDNVDNDCDGDIDEVEADTGADDTG